jgi:hypothetical protein
MTTTTTHAAPISPAALAIVAALGHLIDEADTHRAAYFFTPPGHASARRAYEKRHSVPEITWTESGHTFTAEFSVSCSCRNLYARGTYTKDGQRTTLTAIRNSYNRLKAAAQP